jgi:hypothetical protein
MVSARKTQLAPDPSDSSAPVGPAKLHAGHAPRNISPRAGAKKAWQNNAEHPLLLAYLKGQLIRGNERYTSQQRYEAGDEYRGLFELMHRSGRDSTDINLVSSSVGVSITQEMTDAIRKIAAIELGLKKQDRAIIRHVCGEGWWPSEAVRRACGEHYEKAVVPRFCEALDNLIEAIAAAPSGRMKRPSVGGP